MDAVLHPRIQPLAGMRIPIVAGVGRGSTLLSAFDDALHACGIADYNLIPLSSVIPPGSEVAPVDRFSAEDDEHGHRLYVVKAEMRADQPGLAMAAGIGWYQWGDGRGVFVEHETVGATEAQAAAELRQQICHSLRDLCARRGVPFHSELTGSEIAVTTIDDHATSVLVAAIYQAEAWREPAHQGVTP
jgi:arginine decarboxylase